MRWGDYDELQPVAPDPRGLSPGLRAAHADRLAAIANTTRAQLLEQLRELIARLEAQAQPRRG